MLDLESGQLEWLSNHLGHTVDIHRSFYRLQESTIEMAKVSKVLLAVDSGKVSKYKGKKLDDIDANLNFEGR